MDVNPQTNPSSESSNAAMPSLASKPIDEEDAQKGDSPLSFAWFLVKLVLAVLILRSFVIAPFSIPSESMLPRLWHGDFLIATKWSYGYSSFSLPFNAPLIPGRILASEPKRGDVVIFKHPIDHTDYVKRVVGLPGDTITMRNGQIVLNGAAVSKEKIGDFVFEVTPNAPCRESGTERAANGSYPSCSYKRFRERLPSGVTYDVLDFGLGPGDFTPLTIVPDGHVFVLGDNRDFSRDSRFPALAGDAVGLVPQANLVGRVSVIFWSTDGNAEWLKPWTWLSSARWDRIGTTL